MPVTRIVLHTIVGPKCSSREAGERFLSMLREQWPRTSAFEIDCRDIEMTPTFLQAAFIPLIFDYPLSEVRSKLRFSRISPQLLDLMNRSLIGSLVRFTVPDLPSSPPPKCILVVDDEIEICQLLEDALTLQGYAVVTAQDGWAALAWLDRIKPDAILLDMAMPGMDGWTFLHELALRTPIHPQIPVIVVTARAGMEKECRQAGAVEVFIKPLKFSVLFECLARLFP
ncbi:MAG: response regulator, partial [Candidatus Tectomicrobia bacterium]|nr:response regulator [Candidatus Tectomicrobia bacterium]